MAVLLLRVLLLRVLLRLRAWLASPVPAARAATRWPRTWLTSKRAPEAGLDGRLPRAVGESSSAQRPRAAPGTSATRRDALDDPVSRLTKYTPTAPPGRLDGWDKFRDRRLTKRHRRRAEPIGAPGHESRAAARVDPLEREASLKAPSVDTVEERPRKNSI